MTETQPSRLPAAWRDFAAYLRSPALVAPIGLKTRAAWQTTGLIAMLHIAVLALILMMLTTWQWLTGIEGPSAFENVPGEWLLPIAVIAAPVIEEAVFRGWFTGRPRAIWLAASAVALVVATVMVAPQSGKIVLGLGLLVIPALWFALRKRPAPGWFTKRFSWIFYGSAVGFALVHVANYSSPGLLHLPMVLPQLWAGLTLGFLRMRVGLPAAMLVHAVSNALALTLATSAG